MSLPETRTRAAAVLITAGLAVEWTTLRWAHPTAFFAFVGIGGLLLAAGVLVFLTVLLKQ